MLVNTLALLRMAERGEFAIGAFNVYNLEGALAVVQAAEAAASPVMLQIMGGSTKRVGRPLAALCLEAASSASMPMAVHLDHCSSRDEIEGWLEAGLKSVMADGSDLDYEANVEFTRDIAKTVHYNDGVVEAELGRLTGEEDGLTIPDYESKLTDPALAADFVERTGADVLDVCIGNVHGRYRSDPRLDFERLEAIERTVTAPLALHGGSGLDDDSVRRCIELGVRKINVNTEMRTAYVRSLAESVSAGDQPEFVDVMDRAVAAMRDVVAGKLRLFGSSGG